MSFTREKGTDWDAVEIGFTEVYGDLREFLGHESDNKGLVRALIERGVVRQGAVYFERRGRRRRVEQIRTKLWEWQAYLRDRDSWTVSYVQTHCTGMSTGGGLRAIQRTLSEEEKVAEEARVREVIAAAEKELFLAT